ncbi:hypothetical protein SAMN04487981_106112 [Streptomyces sp. cf386]|uniref:hypothetical protein n=1 Tax=Streptomyces sp. cf386 TaxID=1761904 RepID=UPI00088F1638|nr:hypothetical protein [Streptomyces sp. cf386]SDN66569.1 hypothetical protein SAMN04487981_106112 [Streptomyces sp. cf386]
MTESLGEGIDVRRLSQEGHRRFLSAMERVDVLTQPAKASTQPQSRQPWVPQCPEQMLGCRLPIFLALRHEFFKRLTQDTAKAEINQSDDLALHSTFLAASGEVHDPARYTGRKRSHHKLRDCLPLGLLGVTAVLQDRRDAKTRRGKPSFPDQVPGRALPPARHDVAYPLAHRRDAEELLHDRCAQLPALLVPGQVVGHSGADDTTGRRVRQVYPSRNGSHLTVPACVSMRR